MKACFANILRHEAAKCFTNRWYVLALGICVAFGVVSALGSWGYVRGVLVPFGDLTSNMSCFANGMIANCNASLAATIFFYTAPAIVCIPYAWSYHTERLSGYDAQVALRVPAGMRMAAKAMATFLSGCSLMAAALVVNAVLLACLLPAWVPIIEEWDILGIFYDSLFTGLFYTHPLAYLVAYGCMDACICGVWACFVASLSWATRNRSALLLVSSLLALSVMGERTGGLEHVRMAALGLRSAWWVCRCVRVAALVVVEILALVLAVCAWSAAHGQELTWSLHRSLFYFEGVSVRPDVAFPLSGVSFFISCALAVLALAQIQQVVAWFSQVAVALIASCGFLIASSYARASALFANALMAARWEGASTQAVSMPEALLVACVLACVLLSVGWAACRRRDLMEKGSSQ